MMNKQIIGSAESESEFEFEFEFALEYDQYLFTVT